jgi:hypothetical protein
MMLWMLAAPIERFQAKRIPVRVKKTRQNEKLEPGSDSIGTETTLAAAGSFPERATCPTLR